MTSDIEIQAIDETREVDMSETDDLLCTTTDKKD